MANQNVQSKIIEILSKRGPSLPVHISKETGLSILFASAYLSELVKEKEIKISNMKVGGSPVYFLAEQEHLLENFYQYLNEREKEAFLLLKEKKLLEDQALEPAIRVALRNLRDFAIPFRYQEKIFWKYFLTKESPEELLKKQLPKTEEEKPKKEKKFGERQERIIKNHMLKILFLFLHYTLGFQKQPLMLLVLPM